MLNNTYGGDKITFHYRYRKQIIIASVLLLIIGITIYFFLTRKPTKTSKKEVEPIVNKKEEKKSSQESTIKYQVDIKGEVINPGIYTMDSSSRVIDVIKAAGGLTQNANTSVINLSKKITDEMVIIVYSNNEVEDFKKTKELEEQVSSKCKQNDKYGLENDACISSDTKLESLISLNDATVADLIKLPGIGEAKANDIIAYRNEHGPFENIEDLKNVSGIGENLFAKIKDYLTI